MRWTIHVATVLLTVGMLTLAIGCTDPKARITQLEAENDQLLTDLDTCENELGLAEQQLNELRTSQSGMEAQYRQLQAALNQAKQSPTPATKQGDFTVLGPNTAWLSIPGSVLFAPGKATLKGDAATRVSSVASQITSQFAGRDIFVIGHTDSDPIRKSGWKDNYELSCQRSLAVARQLVSRGVAANHVVAAGCGEHRPVASNASASSKRQNRRVEIFAVSSSFAGTK